MSVKHINETICCVPFGLLLAFLFTPISITWQHCRLFFIPVTEKKMAACPILNHFVALYQPLRAVFVFFFFYLCAGLLV